MFSADFCYSHLISMCVILAEEEGLWEHQWWKSLVVAKSAVSPSDFFYWIFKVSWEDLILWRRNVWFFILTRDFIVLSYVSETLFLYFLFLTTCLYHLFSEQHLSFSHSRINSDIKQNSILYAHIGKNRHNIYTVYTVFYLKKMCF